LGARQLAIIDLKRKGLKMIRKLILIIPALVFAFGNKQQYEIDKKAQQIGFSKIFYEDKYGAFNSMVYDNSNNIIIAGVNRNSIVLKIDEHGNQLWEKRYGDRFSSAEYIEKASKNTYILMTSIQGDKIGTQVLLIDTYGNLKGESFFPIILQQDSKIKQTKDKGFILVSGYNIIKINANGFEVWHQKYKSIDFHENLDFNDFIELDNDEYLFIGKKWIKNKYEERSAYMMRTDSKGNVTWNKEYPSIKEFQKIIVKENEFVLMGNTPLQVTITKMDKEGNIIWNYTRIDDTNTFGRDFILNQSGNLVVVGKEYVSDVKSYLMIFELTNNGELLWQNSYGLGLGKDTATAILEVSDGYIMSGEINTTEYKENEFGLFPVTERAWIFKVNKQGVYRD
jgi:hypothetical protein